MKEWLIADTHYYHKNILEFENRPFKDIEEMKEKMIEAWNNVISKHDKVYIVGDFCFGKEKSWIEILEQLKGEIILIKGNHDHHKVIKKVKDAGYISEIHEVGLILRLDKIELIISHFPIELGERPNRINIHGHIHNEFSNYIDQINVGVDSEYMKNYYDFTGLPFGTPVSLDYLKENISLINNALTIRYKRDV